jgi:Xaa-Pro aminopeptidase
MFLVDSGAQYPDGTTDVTRTVMVGEPTAEMRDRFTRVLKGHIALATARFPEGTIGMQLDSFARRPLWEVGLDYDHGTGHGVGSYLSVHEGPQNISKKPVMQKLLPGMVCSNEPGFYKAGAFGIRIENLIVVNAPEIPEGGERGMMSFETITLVPIDRNLIEVSLLTEPERSWVNDYHARVYATVGPLLDDAGARAWLERVTKPL